MNPIRYWFDDGGGDGLGTLVEVYDVHVRSSLPPSAQARAVPALEGYGFAVVTARVPKP
jgi:hypothetical protein